MGKVFVKRGRAKPLWHGHPWLYSQAIEKVEGSPEPGADVTVLDEQGHVIGRGFYNPASQIAVRLCTWRDEPIDAAFIRRRIEAARALRRKLGFPSADTTAYRLINAEGDGLPGLIADVYGDACTVQIGALGMKHLEEAVLDALEATLAPAAIYQASPGGVAAKEGFTVTPGLARGVEAEAWPFLENGIQYTVDPLAGQKTGAFLDQRENRARIGRLAQGARVLDCYTYLGGFALNCLRGGAASATAVDISPRALERARAHAETAGLGDRLELVEADVFRHLETIPERTFDLVILDPPKFAPSKKDLEPALKGYKKLNALGMRAVKEGGLLATASCSQIVDVESFERTVARAALEAERRLSLLEIHHQPADHPVPPGFTEGRYLKLLLCRVE